MQRRLNIGGAIQRLRKERGWKLRELDRRADLTQNHSSGLERRGVARIELETFRAYAKAFGLTLDELEAVAEEMTEPSDTCPESEAA